MTNYKPDPEFGLGSFVEDQAPVPRRDFTEANGLHSFTFDDDLARLNCPDDCGAFCEPANLGEAVDWAVGHKCEPFGEPAPRAAGQQED